MILVVIKLFSYTDHCRFLKQMYECIVVKIETWSEH